MSVRNLVWVDLRAAEVMASLCVDGEAVGVREMGGELYVELEVVVGRPTRGVSVYVVVYTPDPNLNGADG